MQRKYAGPLPQHLETKAGAFRFKADTVNEDGTFEGYASVWGIVDRGWDVVEAGAFTASLTQHKADGTVPKMLLEHTPGQIPGIWLDFKEDNHGLWVKGKLLLDVQRGRETHILMKHGALDSMSIGYEVKEEIWEREGNQQLRRLPRIDLWEVSIVTFPMLPDARIGTVKRDLSLTNLRARAPLATKAHAGGVNLMHELADVARSLKARDDALRHATR